MSRLTREELRSHLRAGVDILRNTAEPFNYLSGLVMFGLLFLKRMSDQFEAGLSGDTYRIPGEARWTRLEGSPKDISRTLDEAFSALSDANPPLSPSLDGITFASASHALGSPEQIDRLLSKVILHLSILDLSDASLPGPDALGHACDDLIECLADAAGRKGHGEWAPSSLSRLLVELVDPEERHHICDPACGFGLNLVLSAQHVANKSGKNLSASNSGLTLHGQERYPVAWAICKLNLLLHNITNSRVEVGDVIVDPKLTERGALIKYDRILCSPPFRRRIPSKFALTNDIHNRFHHNQSIRPEFAFIQHIVASLTPDGCAAVVLPHGTLFRGSSDVAVRKDLLETDLFEAVIGLPPNLFWGTSISVAVVILNKSKRPERVQNVLFVDASNDYESRPGRNILRPEDVGRIVATVRSWRDDASYCRVVPTAEIEQNDFDMSIARYLVEPEPQGDDIAELLKCVADAEQARDIATARMDAILAEFGICCLPAKS